MLYAGVVLAFTLILLTFFSYAYHIVLTIAVFFMVLLSLLLALPNSQQVIISRFELNNQGQCSFEDESYYQLLANSRHSFLGVWLVLQPIHAVNARLNSKNISTKKLVFIYRDSLTKQDFSRLTQVIAQLNHQG